MPGLSVTINANSNVSGIIDLGPGTSLVGVYVPTNFNGNTFTFQTSLDGSTFFNVESGANAVVTATIVAAPCYVAVDPFKFAGVRYLQITSGSPQTADRKLTLATSNVG